MNYFTLEVSIVLTLLAAAMWGSWMQIVKYLKGYSITGIVFLLYSFSFILIWGITWIVAPSLLDEGIIVTTIQNKGVVLKILLGGGLMSIGLYFSLAVIKEVGLLLSTTISGGVGTILGLATSIAEEGLPDRENALLLIVAVSVVMLIAGQLCNMAANRRDQELEKKKDIKAVSPKMVALMLFTAILTNGWSMGTAAGTASGFAPVLTCAYMATGSFLSVFIVLGTIFTVKKQWKQVFCIGASKTPIYLGIIAATCHYGGNLISIYSMPAISATMSFLFGKTSAIWTILWGIYYKEFAGIKPRTKMILSVGIFLYFVGIALLGVYQFG